VVIGFRFSCIENFIWQNNELMTIVNGNAKTYIYYYYYCFSNVPRSIKWYNIAIQVEIIFCRCGSYFWWFRTLHSAPFFQPVPDHQFRTEIAVPHRCAVQKKHQNQEIAQASASLYFISGGLEGTLGMHPGSGGY